MSAATAPERRLFPRGELAASAIVLGAGRYVGTYLVRNLSAGGALLVGDAALEPKDKVRVLLRVNGHRAMTLAARVDRQHVSRAGERSFSVVFPDLDAETQDELQQLVLRALERAHGDKPAVLVLDDMPEVRHALRRDVRALGFEPLLAASPLEAMEHFYGGGPPLCAVLVDFRLGTTDGLEFLAFVADDYPSVRRILISGELRRAQLELAVAAKRADAILGKPWSRESLAGALSV